MMLRYGWLVAVHSGTITGGKVIDICNTKCYSYGFELLRNDKHNRTHKYITLFRYLHSVSEAGLQK